MRFIAVELKKGGRNSRTLVARLVARLSLDKAGVSTGSTAAPGGYPATDAGGAATRGRRAALWWSLSWQIGDRKREEERLLVDIQR